MKKGLDGDKAVVMISPVDDLVMLIHKENILASGGSIASRNYITLNEDNTVSDLIHLSSLIDYLSNTLTSLMLSIPD